MLSLTVQDFIDALANEPTGTRKYAYFAFETIKKVCPRALVHQATLSKNYLSHRANDVYEFAGKDEMLDALRIALMVAYEFQRERHPELIPPHQLFPIKKSLPILHEGSPPFALQDALAELLHVSSARLEKLTLEAQAIVLLLLIAERAGILQASQLEGLIKAQQSITIFPDSKRAVLKIDNGHRILLDAPSLLMLRSISKKHAFRALKRFSAILERLCRESKLAKSLILEPAPTLSTALNALTFSTRPLALTELTPLFSPLSDSLFNQAISGEVISSSEIRSPSRRRRHVREFKKFETLAKIFENHTHRALAISPTVDSHDHLLLERVRDALVEFQAIEPNQRRSGSAYEKLKTTLLSLIADGLEDAHISHLAMLAALYIVDLTLYGTNTKKELRVSSLTTYLSRLKTLLLAAFSDNEMLTLAQSDISTLEEHTEFLAKVIGDFSTSSEQSTAINFLQYVHQVSGVTFFCADTLEYEGVCDVVVRTHYIPPQTFEKTCNAFLKPIDSAERRQYVLFATLCHGLGLRRQEAQRLEIEDVRFDADDLLVTRLIKRKTQRAVRRVRLSFLKITDRVALENHIEVRSLRGCTHVFDAHVLAALDKEFVETLRNCAQHPRLVIHSLRHCAANNMLFQLALCCFSNLLQTRDRYFFLTSDVFSDAQLSTIRADVDRAGRETTPYFPILDTLAYLLGHVSPAVTAQSYLHLLDILFFELNAMREKPLDIKALMSLAAHNQYKFEHKKRYTSALKAGLGAAENYVFSHACRGLNAARYFLVKRPKAEVGANSRISFGDYIAALDLYQNQPQRFQTKGSLYDHFKKIENPINIEFTTQWSSGDFPVWLRLLERLNALDGNEIQRNALRALCEAIVENGIFNKRALKRYLHALSILGLQSQTLILNTPRESEQVSNWRDIILEKEHQLEINLSPELISPSLSPRPRALRFAPWSKLPLILDAYESYLNFQLEQ